MVSATFKIPVGFSGSLLKESSQLEDKGRLRPAQGW